MTDNANTQAFVWDAVRALEDGSFYADYDKAGLYLGAIRDALTNIPGGVFAIAQERWRQVNGEGWSPEHDDEHGDGSLAQAAACYANPMTIVVSGVGAYPDSITPDDESMPMGWPYDWDFGWWKPTDRRRDLVKAGALIAAEIDRLDRMEGQKDV